jgi:hypothetical protein
MPSQRDDGLEIECCRTLEDIALFFSLQQMSGRFVAILEIDASIGSFFH